MTRAIFGEALLFFVPFALFAAYLVAQRRNPLKLDAWSSRVGWLAIAGLGCAIAGFIVTGALVERPRGAFVPTHVEDGRVVPGRFR